MKELHLSVRVRNNMLLERRQNLGCTQNELAAYAGVGRQRYAQLECLRRQPVKDGKWTREAIALAEFYDCGPEDLFPAGVLAVRAPTVERGLDAEEVSMLLMSDHSERLMLPPGSRLQKEELCDAVDEALASLAPREAELLTRRFGLDGGRSESLEEIGKGSGIHGGDITRDHVRQIEGKALRKLRHPTRAKHLRPFK